MPDMLPAMLAGSTRPAVPVLIVAALVGAPGLVGCTGSDPKPATISTPPTTPAPSTPSATSPAQQVEATMRAYFVVTNAAFKTGRVDALRAFSSSGCPCRKAANSIERTISRGGHFEGLQYQVRSIRVHDLQGDTALAEVVARVPPYKVFDSQGKVTEKSAGGRLHTDYSLVRSGDRWIIGNALNLE
jgi:hypothetical protein